MFVVKIQIEELDNVLHFSSTGGATGNYGVPSFWLIIPFFFFLMSNILLASPVLAVTDLPADNEFGPVVSDT